MDGTERVHQIGMSLDEMQKMYVWLWKNPTFNHISEVPEAIRPLMESPIMDERTYIAKRYSKAPTVEAAVACLDAIRLGDKSIDEMSRTDVFDETVLQFSTPLDTLILQGRERSHKFLAHQMSLIVKSPQCDPNNPVDRALIARFGEIPPSCIHTSLLDWGAARDIREIQRALRWLYQEDIALPKWYFSSVPIRIRDEVRDALTGVLSEMKNDVLDYEPEDIRAVEDLIDGGPYEPEKTPWQINDAEYFQAHYLDGLEQELMDELVQRGHLPNDIQLGDNPTLTPKFYMER